LTNDDAREFYVEVAYAWPEAYRYIPGNKPLTLEHPAATEDVVLVVDNANGGLVIGVSLQTEVETCQHGEPVSVAGDLLWAQGEALGIADEVLDDYLSEKGLGELLMPDPHHVSVVHVGGLMGAMMRAAEGMESKRETFGDDEGLVGS
jgi:hypothetical protein